MATLTIFVGLLALAGVLLLALILYRFHRFQKRLSETLDAQNSKCSAWEEVLGKGLGYVLGDRRGKLAPSGLTCWVEGVVTPPYRTRGGKVVATPWRAWMGRVGS